MKRNAYNCIHLNDKGLEIKVDEKFYPNFEGTIIPIQIGKNYFEVILKDKEINSALKKYDMLSDCDYETIEGIVALEKLTKLLKLGIDITFSDEVIK